MIKFEAKEITKTQTTQYYYCDCCGEFLGSSLELEDGCCPIPDTVYEIQGGEIDIRFGGLKYTDKINLGYDIVCKKCFNKIQRKFKELETELRAMTLGEEQ